MITIAFANQKGGVAKTNSAQHIGHGLALAGLSVLLIDLDSQGNLADGLGLDPSPGLFDWLARDRMFGEVVTRVRSDPALDLWLIRGDKRTAELKMVLSSTDFREYILVNAIEDLKFDVVIFDCAPSVDVLHTAALVASDWLIIPTKLDQYAIKGVQEILRSVKSVQRAANTRCHPLCILPTFYDRSTKETQEQLENLAGAFGSQVWGPIPVDNKIRVANRLGLSLYECYPTSRALVGYPDGRGGRIGGYQAAVDKLTRIIHPGS